jgi:hypothetical protein
MGASLDLALDAGAAIGSDSRAMGRACRQHHAIAWMKRERASITEDEIDRPARAVQEFVVRVRVLFVSITWAVRPPVDIARL